MKRSGFRLKEVGHAEMFDDRQYEATYNHIFIR